MKILVDHLTVTPTDLSFEGNAAWWRAVMPEHAELPRVLLAPIEFRLEAHRMGQDVYLEGGAEGALELECSRCLARYGHRLREAFRLVLEPAGSRISADPEAVAALDRDGLCLGDEFETGWYRGGEIRLDSVCLEVISLALPVQPLCREECPGLCSRCGAELAEGPCGCDEARPNSPFAVLAALRDETEGVS